MRCITQRVRPLLLRGSLTTFRRRCGKATRRFLSKGESATAKRLAEVGAVYDLQPVPRQARDLLDGSERGNDPPAPRPKATNKWGTVSVVDDPAEVIAAVFDEAERRDLDHRRAWVTLVDGNNHQIQRIQTAAQNRDVTITIVTICGVPAASASQAARFLRSSPRILIDMTRTSRRRVRAARADGVAAHHARCSARNQANTSRSLAANASGSPG